MLEETGRQLLSTLADATPLILKARAVSIAAALIAIVVTLMQWSTRPQTDDATVRANFVGIAPQVSGHIVELSVHDNQQVNKGDLLFVIDNHADFDAGADTCYYIDVPATPGSAP